MGEESVLVNAGKVREKRGQGKLGQRRCGGLLETPRRGEKQSGGGETRGGGKKRKKKGVMKYAATYRKTTVRCTSGAWVEGKQSKGGRNIWPGGRDHTVVVQGISEGGEKESRTGARSWVLNCASLNNRDLAERGMLG